MKVFHGKFKTRKCGACGEDDTILFCCECLRKEKVKILKKELGWMINWNNLSYMDPKSGWKKIAERIEELEKEIKEIIK